MIIDVFISRKSQDNHLARQLMAFLTDKGLSVFDSDDLPKHGSSDYRKAIDQALDAATHLVVVCSAAAFVTSPWVEAEWGFYVNEKRAGRKAGNLLTLVEGDVATRDLPPSLRSYEVITFGVTGFDRVYAYVSIGCKPALPHNWPTENESEQQRPLYATGPTGGTGAGLAAPALSTTSFWQREGEKQYRQGDYTTAVSHFYKAAEAGYAPAQKWLGLCYHRGQGVEQNDAASAAWYYKAAEQEDAIAQYNIGVAYANGAGVTQSDSEAVRWYRKAAEQGNAQAQNNLAISYTLGQGIAQNYAEAFRWYRQAAAQGYVSAQTNLGVVYRKGEGTEENHGEAVKWFGKAAEQGGAQAQCNLGIAYFYGEGVEKNFTKAIVCFRKAAEQNHALAQCFLGHTHHYGKGVAIDLEQAKQWYQLAVLNGNDAAKTDLKIVTSRLR